MPSDFAKWKRQATAVIVKRRSEANRGEGPCGRACWWNCGVEQFARSLRQAPGELLVALYAYDVSTDQKYRVSFAP